MPYKRKISKVKGERRDTGKRNLQGRRGMADKKYDVNKGLTKMKDE